jgi:hypothetical protein
MTRLLTAAALLAAVAALVFTRAATSDPTPVAYVGCSVSELSVHGYHIDGGVRMWPGNSKYDSGFVSTWAGALTSRWWVAFDSMNAQYPGAQQVWWQLCVQTGQNIVDLDRYALTVLDRIHLKLPGATVYVSDLPVYLEQPCATTGEDGIALGQAEADSLVARGLVEAGPVMPPLPLLDRYIGSPCHPNFRGQKLEGTALVGMFG